MALGPRRTATSYDDILRATVPNPDSSFRPSREEEEMSRHRFGAPTEHRPHAASRAERDLLDRVQRALFADNTIDLTDVEIEIDGSQVILLGTVPGPATRVRIEDIAASIHGVEQVDNQLVIRRHA
jgi:osmotically-inducible protein OsmY